MFRFDSLAEIPHAISTRHGGVSRAPYDSLNVGYGTEDDESNVAANRAILLKWLELEAERLIAARLVHGSEVSVFLSSESPRLPVARQTVRDGSERTENFFLSDGVVSDVPGLHVLLTCADCVPLLFYDPVRGVMGAAHAGWRGTAAGIGMEVVRTMVGAFGSRPGHIIAGVGPSVGPCCYSVSDTVLDTFKRLGTYPEVDHREGQAHLDLWASNERQLNEVGVTRVEQSRICTACHVETYFSHRGEAGKTGRFALVAGLSA